ncbi:uncharacterized protein ARMOST_19416 [Armillaria ostoyae]|uniref:Uncharacterized protein n=1 Tax=Armillaria ostoyae TaxID=47428 RepID=A0A284S4G5_ARMOS|nr:uncharacterized protein ARMOST_19416 [Armillaria ostoyae]
MELGKVKALLNVQIQEDALVVMEELQSVIQIIKGLIRGTDYFGASGGEIEMVQGTGEKPESEWACSIERMSSRNTSVPLRETGNDADEARIVKISKCSQRDSAFAKELPHVAPITVPEATKPPKTKNEYCIWTQVSQLIQPISRKKLPLLKQLDEMQLVV